MRRENILASLFFFLFSSPPFELMSLVRLCESAAADAAVAASSAAPSGGGSNGRPKSVMIHQVYGKAIISIAKYPLEITSAAEAEQLQGSEWSGCTWSSALPSDSL